MDPIEHAWSDITVESAKFILDESQKKREETIDTARSLTDRALTVLQFAIPLSLVLIGLIATDPKKEWLWLYLIALILLIVISYMALHMYEMYGIQSSKRDPNDLLKGVMLGLDSRQQYLGLIFCALRDIESDIESNEIRNEERFRLFFWIMCLVKILIGLASVYIATAILVLYTGEAADATGILEKVLFFSAYV